jgi:DNA recombination protein RmuC
MAMDSVLLAASLVFGLVNAVLLVLLYRRRTVIDVEPLRPCFESLSAESRRTEESLRGEFARSREESNRAAGELREEVARRMTEGLEGLLKRHSESQLTIERRLDKISEGVSQHLEKMRQTVDGKLTELQAKNEQKLEEMRRTVDEKLAGTLEKRLGDSFKLVSERLEAVHKGLGEMQVMATSVGDLKRVLTNVKARGTWGEIQLGALLEQVLTPEQYAANVTVKPGSLERVEFAIRLPGPRNGEPPVWVPIDAKFPQEDYQRLVEAADRGDAEAVAEAGKALENRLRKQARDISEKYVLPPCTTDFALLFLPSESLYAEVLRRPGLAAGIQQDYRVTIAGPTTLAALLNSLQMGFRTLAIQQRTSEVWTVLSAVKGEFGKFGEVLANVKVKPEQASKQIEQTEVRTRAINRKLRDVQELPSAEAARLLAEANGATDELPEQADVGMLPLGGLLKIDK